MPHVKARAVYDFNAGEMEDVLLDAINAIRVRDGKYPIDDWSGRGVEVTQHKAGGCVVVFNDPGVSELVRGPEPRVTHAKWVAEIEAGRALRGAREGE